MVDAGYHVDRDVAPTMRFAAPAAGSCASYAVVRSAIALGLLLLIPSAWIEFSGRPMPWWAGGAALVAGATGAALLWTGLVGAKPDWIDQE